MLRGRSPRPALDALPRGDIQRPMPPLMLGHGRRSLHDTHFTYLQCAMISRSAALPNIVANSAGHDALRPEIGHHAYRHAAAAIGDVILRSRRRSYYQTMMPSRRHV